MKIKYLPKENAEYLYKLLEIIQTMQPDIWFKVYDDQMEFVYKGSDIVELIEEIDGIDSNFEIYCYKNNKSDKKAGLGWFFITPWEERDCLVCDYIDNQFCNDVIERLKEDE